VALAISVPASGLAVAGAEIAFAAGIAPRASTRLASVMTLYRSSAEATDVNRV
jgi:hypothetical protein